MIKEGPILNRLNTVQPGTRLSIEYVEPWGETSKIDSGNLEHVFPSAEGPLRIDLLNPEGSISFAGADRGIVRITVEPEGSIVFDNPRIPNPEYFPPGSIDVLKDEHVTRQVEMGLYDSAEALIAARDAASR